MKCSLYGIIGYRTLKPPLMNREPEPQERAHFQPAVGDSVYIVQNVNARGTIYSMWIILRKCEGGCEARLVRSRADLVGVLVLNYSKTGGR